MPVIKQDLWNSEEKGLAIALKESLFSENWYKIENQTELENTLFKKKIGSFFVPKKPIAMYVWMMYYKPLLPFGMFFVERKIKPW